MAVRLFVGNLSYATTEADLRTYFGTVAPPSQVVLPVDRETGRPARLRVRGIYGPAARRAGDPAVQRSALQWTAAGRQRSASARRPRTGRLSARRVVWTAAARRLCAQAALVVRRAATSLRSVGTGRAAQPEFRTRRQAATRRQCKGQEEGRRASARSHSPQENRAILVPRRRLARRGAAGYRRFRDQPASGRSRQGRRYRRRQGQEGDKEDEKEEE